MPRRFISKPTLLVSAVLVAAVCGATAIAIRREQRQQRLNRALIHAILYYDTDTALALLRDGADPNTREQPDPVPPVWQQLRNILLRHKPPVNESDSALVLIMDSTVDRPKQAKTDNGIPRENAHLVAALLDNGARVNGTDDILQTALKQATGWDYGDTTHILIAHGANVNIADTVGETPLMAAVRWGNEDITRLLLKCGANPNAQDHIGGTALMAAQCHDFSPQVLKGISAEHLQKWRILPMALKVLLQYRPDFTLKNRNGETALAEARKRHQTQKVRLLLQAGAKE